MKYRKKPVVIDAEQLDGTVSQAERLGVTWVTNERGQIQSYQLSTLEGMMSARPGAWLLTGVEGERYFCAPSVFEKTYEPAEPVELERCPARESGGVQCGLPRGHAGGHACLRPMRPS